MSDEIDDNEFFQQDFSTATEWEIFNARLEEIFHEWKLPYTEPGKPLSANELSTSEWDTMHEVVFFADVELNITRYWAKLSSADTTQTIDPIIDDKNTSQSIKCQAFDDLMSLNNDYCIIDERSSDKYIHPIARWYGIRDFVIISPAKKSISNESQIRILLSSIHIAAAESNCEIPIFVQALERKQNVYAGVCENRTTKLSFDIVHLCVTPITCKYLSGLLDLFKGKIATQYINPVQVSTRFAYSLTKFFNTSFVSDRQYAFSDLDFEPLSIPDKTYRILPFGVSIDPVTELLLFCSWPHVAENVVIDSQNYSDFDPLLAPVWMVRSRFESKPICYLSECISEYLQLCESRKSLVELLGENYMYSGSLNLDGNALNLLTESKISTFNIASVLPTFASASASLSSRSSDTRKSGSGSSGQPKPYGPINEEQLMQMLYYMFPDAQQQSVYSYPMEKKDVVRFYYELLSHIIGVLTLVFNYYLQVDPLKIKTASDTDSLVHRMSSLLALCNNYFGGVKAIAQLWAEFTQEMRFRVERCIQIPG